MRYLLMIFEDPSRPWTGSESDKAGMAELFAIQADLEASGELVDGQGLAEASAALTVLVRDGTPVVSDGPFAEAKEHLAGYLLVDCDRDRAVAIAARIAASQDHPVQVRPVMDEATMRAACE